MVELLNTLTLGPGDWGQAGKGGGSGVISRGWDTHSRRRIRIDPAAAHLAFLEAEARLPAEGGTLRLSKGTAPYSFTSIANMTKPFRLEADRGAVITKTVGNRTCFNVTKAAEFSGVRFSAAPTAAAPASQSFVEVNGAASADAAADCRFEDCNFLVLQNANNVEGFFAVRAIGNSNNGPLWFDRCRYVARVGTANAWAWVGEETSGQGTNEYSGVPYGCGFLKATKFRHIHINHCEIMGEGHGTADQAMGVGIILDDCHYVSIHEMKISSTTHKATSGSDHASPILVFRGVADEGHHMQVTDLFAELLQAKHLIYSRSPRWLKVLGMDMGRGSGTYQSATIKAQGIAGGDSVILVGCSSHNVVGPVGVGNRLYDIDGVSNFSAVACQATFRTDYNDPFLVTNCQNVRELGNLHEIKRTA